MRNQAPTPLHSRLCRRVLATAATLLGALALIAPAGAGATEVAARPADSFVDSIGVNTHTYYDDTPYYTEFGTVAKRLQELGIRHIREGLALGREDQYRSLNALAAVGVRSTLILGEPEIGSDGLAEMLTTLKTSLAGSVEAVEGSNEYDTTGGPDWAPRLAAYQQQLYTSIKSDPALADLPVIGPSIVQKRNQEALGDISGSLDYGNVHPYPQGDAPERNVSTYLARAALNSGAKPVMATETGYHNAMGWTGEQTPVSEQAAATYMPRLFLDYFERGYARTFAYELVDQGPDPANRDANWGLLRRDLSEKPAFVSIRNLISILADPGPAFSPEAIDYDVSGNRTGLHQVLLQKRDGSVYLALWRDASISAAGADLASPTSRVVLDFQRSVDDVQRFDPTVAATPVGNVGHDGARVSVGVGPRVTILRLSLGAASSGRIKLWVSRSSVSAGSSVSVGGRLPKPPAGGSRKFDIQRWQSTGSRWATVGHGRAAASGKFKKAIRIPANFDSVSRLRVVASRARPSKPVRLRVHGADGALAGSIDTAVALAP